MTLGDFVGNQRIVSVLQQMLQSDRVPHALLFSGQKGVGKFTLATLFARAANCRQEPGTVCGTCENCRTLAALDDIQSLKAAALDARGSANPESVPLLLRPHPDTTVIVPDGAFIRVGQMRAVLRQAYSRPVAGRRSVFLFDEAERLRFDYADVLLKALEEPPEHTTLILVTDAPYKLRATLRSRCIAFHFAPLSTQEIEAYLATHRRAWNKAERALAAAVGAGSLGSALGLDLPLYHQIRSEALHLLQAAAGREIEDRLFSATAALAGKGGRGGDGGRETLEFSLDILYSLLKDVLYLRAGTPEMGLHNPDLRSDLDRIARRVDLRWVVAAVTQLDRIDGWQRRNVNRQLALDAWALELNRRFSQLG